MIEEPAETAPTVRYPATWSRESVAWAKRRGLDQISVNAIEADLMHFRQAAAENQKREATRAKQFEDWWHEHGEAHTHMYNGLRGLEVGETVTPGNRS